MQHNVGRKLHGKGVPRETRAKAGLYNNKRLCECVCFSHPLFFRSEIALRRRLSKPARPVRMSNFQRMKVETEKRDLFWEKPPNNNGEILIGWCATPVLYSDVWGCHGDLKRWCERGVEFRFSVVEECLAQNQPSLVGVFFLRQLIYECVDTQLVNIYLLVGFFFLLSSSLGKTQQHVCLQKLQVSIFTACD